MKLAEALILRADLKKRLAQLQARIVDNVRVQEGDEPSENPNDLVAEFSELLNQFYRLVTAVNETNLASKLPSGQSLTSAISDRDELKVRIAMLRPAADGAAGKQARVTRSEVKFVSVINIGEFRAEADRCSRQYRELDATIQAANWTTDLIQ